MQKVGREDAAHWGQAWESVFESYYMGVRCFCGISAGDVLQNCTNRAAARSQGWTQFLLLPSPEKKKRQIVSCSCWKSTFFFFFFPMIYKSMEQELGIRWISLVLILMYAEARMPSDRVSAVWAPALSVTWISITRALLLQGQVQSLSTLQLTQATNHRMFPLNM